MSTLKLGPCCSVVGCSLRPGTNLLSEIKVFRFPKNKAQRDAWIAAVKRRGWTPTSNSRICSTHFISGKPSDDPLSPDYAPSKFPHKPDPSRRMLRYQRSVRRSSAFHSSKEESKDMVRVKEEKPYADECLSMRGDEDLQNPNTSLKEQARSQVSKVEMRTCERIMPARYFEIDVVIK
ncbi:peroxynitrite isomerase THAP4-like [Xyrauchen texanus]|uniref:peroxynitrite isomerase THAP4-like n=1 Tax=Xyrauchen texanus TaxID=154827 RepID=UPI002242310D|nr:peroxynitrite isomerase THAP4-like [Xyrauchen texanus]